MQTIEQIENTVREILLAGGLPEREVKPEARVDDLGDLISVDVVVSDAADVRSAREALEQSLHSPEVYLSVRSVWRILEIGAAQIAYGENGSPRAAILVPVTMESGSTRCLVTVSITKLAEMSFERILGQSPDPRTIAGLVIEAKVKLGGSSAWNPETQSWLEVTSSDVADLSRTLRKLA